MTTLRLSIAYLILSLSAGCLLSKTESNEIQSNNGDSGDKSVNSGKCWSEASANGGKAVCYTLTANKSLETLENLCLKANDQQEIIYSFTANEACSIVDSYGACEQEQEGITTIEYYYLNEKTEDRALHLGIARQVCATRHGIFHSN